MHEKFGTSSFSIQYIDCMNEQIEELLYEYLVLYNCTLFSKIYSEYSISERSK